MADQERQPKHNLGLTQELEIDRICRRFEEELRSGAEPLIEPFIENQEEPFRCQLLRELLLLDIEYRKHKGTSLGTNDYLERFPDDLFES